MGMFGSTRDVATMKIFTKELVEDIISQQVGYYKTMLSDTQPNVYGEATTRYFTGPVLIPCLIVRGEFTRELSDFGFDTERDVQFQFFKDHLIEANVVPEVNAIKLPVSCVSNVACTASPSCARCRIALDASTKLSLSASIFIIVSPCAPVLVIDKSPPSIVTAPVIFVAVSSSIVVAFRREITDGVPPLLVTLKNSV